MTELVTDDGLVERTLRRWFPRPAFVKAARIRDYPVLPEEQNLVANAVPRRQAEFATGRFLARLGLRQLGLPDQPIKKGDLGDPLWPESVIGTISHDGDLCAVVLMQASGNAEAGVGIDLISLSQVAGRIDELAALFTADAGETNAAAALNLPVDPALLLFSLKESVVKAISRRFDDFIDLRAIAIRHSGRLAVNLSGDPISADLFAAAAGGYLVTAVKVR